MKYQISPANHPSGIYSACYRDAFSGASSVQIVRYDAQAKPAVTFLEKEKVLSIFAVCTSFVLIHSNN